MSLFRGQGIFPVLLLVDLDCFLEANLEVACLNSLADKWPSPNGMPTVRIESCCLAPQGLLAFAGCKWTCLNGMLTFSNSFLGPQSSHDVVSVQMLMLSRWAVWPFVFANAVWRCCFWMTDEKMLLVGILAAVFFFFGGKRTCPNRIPAIRM